MYFILLAMIPIVMLARRLHPLLPAILSLTLYALVWARGVNLTGNPWTGEGWFFNPFAWQILFFAGFSFGSGWLPKPPPRNIRLLIACVAFLAVSLPIASWHVHDAVPKLRSLHDLLLGAAEKTNLHPLRVVHFFALAYVALALVERYSVRFASWPARTVIGVGQQSLAVFLTSIVTARAAAMAFQLYGTGLAVSAAVNLFGAVVIILASIVARAFKSTPWRKAASTPRPAGAHPAGSGALA